MSILEWSSKFELGITEVDRQHKELFDLAGHFYKLFSEGADKAETLAVLDKLYVQAHKHFDFEEKYMKLSEHEKFVSHKGAHFCFSNRMKEFRAAIMNSKPVATTDTLEFLISYFIDHITSSDADYVEDFLKAGLK